MTKVLIACGAAFAAMSLAGCGSDDGGSTAATTTEPQTQATTTEPPETTETEPAPPAPTEIRIVVRDGRPVGGIARPKVTEGDRVVLVVAADTTGDVHLHGYDLDGTASPGSPARIRFRATIPGRFEIELHAHPEILVGELTVTP